MPTFTSFLTDRVRRTPGEPLITFYDHATGERVELSTITYANWVAKASGLLSEEHDLERGMRLRIDLPPHWLSYVFLGAAWTLGLVVVDDDDPDAVVCGPETLERWSALADDVPVLACSLRPMGVRFAEPLPAGVHDVGIEIWAQPDAFTAWDAPTSEDLAHRWAGAGVSQGDMLEAAAAGSLLTDGGRLMTAANPTSPSGVVAFTEPLVRGGSVVLVAGPDPERLSVTAEQERVTATFALPGAVAE